MEISTSTGMNILLEAAKNPRVQAADQAVERLEKDLDRVQLSLSAPREQRFQLEPTLYEQTWASKSHTFAQMMPLPFMAGLAGTVLGVSQLAAAIPQLAPFRGLLALGSLVAYWKFFPNVVGKVARQHIIPPMVDRGMKQALEGQKAQATEQLGQARRYREAVLRRITDEMYEKVAAEQAAKAAQPPAEVKVDQEWIIVNGIRVPKKTDTGS